MTRQNARKLQKTIITHLPPLHWGGTVTKQRITGRRWTVTATIPGTLTQTFTNANQFQTWLAHWNSWHVWCGQGWK